MISKLRLDSPGTCWYYSHSVGRHAGWLGLRLAFLFLLIATQAWAGALRVDSLLAMSDGARLSIAYFVPTTPPPAGGYPALVLVHGFAGSKNDYAPLAARYADSGYFCVAYTVRGQGQGSPSTASEGGFAWFTGDRELEDCREIIEWVRAHPLVNRDRVGLEGASQGGLTAWGAAVKRMNVRCIVPIIGVPFYSQAIAPNGTRNYFVAVALALADAFDLVRFDAWCMDSLYKAIEQDRYPDVVRLLMERDLVEEIDEIEVPVFMQMAWQDDIFSGHQFFEAFRALQAPKKLFVWPGPHALPGPGLEELRMAMTFRFYRRWLRDEEGEGIMNPDSAVALADPGNGTFHWFHRDAHAEFYPAHDPDPVTRRFYFTSGLALSGDAPATGAAYPRLYIQNVTNDAYVFRSSSLPESMQLLGADASLVVNSTGRKYQANVLLWDFDPVTGARRPITRGSYEVRLEAGEGIARRRITYELSPQLYTLAAGHQLEAWVKHGLPGLPLMKPADEFGQTPYPPQETATDTLFTSPAEPSYLELYIRDDVPLAVERESAPAIHATLTGSPARSGDPIILHFDQFRSGRIDILDIRGTLLRSFEAEGSEISIPTEFLSSGIYFLRFHSNNLELTKRFIVN